MENEKGEAAISAKGLLKNLISSVSTFQSSIPQKNDLFSLLNCYVNGCIPSLDIRRKERRHKTKTF
jgi:hypothetical protein